MYSSIDYSNIILFNDNETTINLKYPELWQLDESEIRLLKDLNELDLPPQCTLSFLNERETIKKFKLKVIPDKGPYVGGIFSFILEFTKNYPFKPPKVKIIEKVYHPNLTLEGNVCLNILREDHRPNFTLTHYILGLLQLMTNPTGVDALNVEIGQLMLENYDLYLENVKKSMNGESISLNDFQNAKTQNYDAILKEFQ